MYNFIGELRCKYIEEIIVQAVEKSVIEQSRDGLARSTDSRLG